MKIMIAFLVLCFFAARAVADDYVICQGKIHGDWRGKCSQHAQDMIQRTIIALDGRGRFNYLSVVFSNNGYAVSMVSELEFPEGRRGGGGFLCRFDKRRVLMNCDFNR